MKTCAMTPGRSYGYALAAAMTAWAAAVAGGADREKTKAEVAFATKLGKEVVERVDQDAFLKKYPRARKNPRDSDPNKGVVAYDVLLTTHVFRDGRQISKSFTIPRVEEAYKRDHARTLESLGRPDRDLLTDDDRKRGVLFNAVWNFRECDLMVVYVVEKVGREYRQTFNVGSIKALDDLDK